MIDCPTVCWKLKHFSKNKKLIHFREALIHCFVLLHYLPTKVGQFLAELVIKQAETEVEGRIEPDPRMKVSMSGFLQSESRFTQKYCYRNLRANVHGQNLHVTEA